LERVETIDRKVRSIEGGKQLGKEEQRLLGMTSQQIFFRQLNCDGRYTWWDISTY
jgi:hypothetical protein